jgi:hypothetical protein
MQKRIVGYRRHAYKGRNMLGKLLYIVILFATTGCIAPTLPPSPLSTPTIGLLPIEVPVRSVATMATPLSTVNPSTALVPQLMDDLARRLNISQDRIALQEIWLLKWKASTVNCPAARRPPKFSQQHVMIVSDDGVKYELPDGDAKPSNTAAAIDLLVGNTVYNYYVIDGKLLFCPGKQ